MFSNGQPYFTVLTDSVGQGFKNGAAGRDPFRLCSRASAGKSLTLGFRHCLELKSSSGAMGGEGGVFAPMSGHLSWAAFKTGLQ